MRGRFIWLLMFALTSTAALASDNPQLDAKEAFERGDYAAAAKILEPLAAQGDQSAQYNLGVIYSNGKGVPRDLAAAASWFEKAARGGNALGQLYVGNMYRDGQGVGKDLPRAYMWFEMSANGLMGKEKAQALRYRDGVAKLMTPEQMQSALDMVDNCQQVGVENCD